MAEPNNRLACLPACGPAARRPPSPSPSPSPRLPPPPGGRAPINHRGFLLLQNQNHEVEALSPRPGVRLHLGWNIVIRLRDIVS